MERVGSVAEFLASPVGRWVATDRVVAWCAARDLIGAAAWGAPVPEDADLLAEVWDALVGGRSEPFDKVFDVRFIERIADDTFARLVEHARQRLPVPRAVRRQLLLAPPGLAAAVTHGFWNVVPSQHPWHVSQDDEEGFAWLGRSAERPMIADAIAAARTPGALGRLRRWLEEHLGDADLGAAARALGISARTLQRQLGEDGTNFRAELRAARLLVARRLLALPDAKVEAVAAAVGCESASSFVRLFRAEYGETPAAWRDRVRG